MGKKTHVLPVRLTEEGYQLVAALAEAQGTSKAAQIELAIRDRAKAHGIRPPTPAPDAPDA